MEVVIRTGKKYILRNLIRKGSNYFKRDKIIRLKNEIINFEIAFGMIHGQPYKGFPKKSPIYQFQLLVT
jgi:hypothetical protein